MMVTGGLTWWRDYLCCACFNLLDQRCEVCNVLAYSACYAVELSHTCHAYRMLSLASFRTLLALFSSLYSINVSIGI